ncbi:MAG: DNA-binding response regulator [Acidobacteria bacterium]|nr:MAG: DNA-binding response regulator [Acidobacteriota bacterium]
MSGARVLVVDDDPQIRRIMRMTLIAQDYEVADARSAEEALKLLEAERYDLILLDMNLPGIGGLEACRFLRSSGTEAAIIMLTVRNTEKDKVEALDAGADDFVTKPFSAPELLARIRAALRRLPLSGEPHVVNLDEVEIDLVQRQIVVRGRRVRLTPKEFDLLLLQAVWGPDHGTEVEYLRTFINQLRKKIEKNPAKPRYILTEPWVGYRFQLP